MNELPTPQNEQNRPAQDSADTSSPQPELNRSAPQCAFQSLCGAVNTGASRAKAAAEKAAPKVQAAAKSALYWTAYGLSYASVFSWTLATHLTPESSKSGFRSGVAAGKEAAGKCVEKMTRSEETLSAETPTDTAPPSAEVQPSPA